MGRKTVIIGGVAGGATTATRLRRKCNNQIILFEKGDDISYANCGLPYYIGDVIPRRETLFLQTPLAMKQKFDVEVRIASEVVKIYPHRKSVMVRNLKNGEEYEEEYDTLVIATGSSPMIPDIKGIESNQIFTISTVSDTDRIKAYLHQYKPQSAVVIGGGFVGLEMAENLRGLGMEVSLVEMQNQVMSSVDFEMAQLLHEQMRSHQVQLILGDGVELFAQKQNKVVITLKSGKKIDTDMVILSIGVIPNSKLAMEAGLAFNEKGGIVVDQYLKTSDANIYAVGDVVEVVDYVLGNKTMVPLAGPANKQGRICADNIVAEMDSDRKAYHGSQGTSIAKVFDLSVAIVGMNEKKLWGMNQEKGKDYNTALILQKSHASYYPGATDLTMKLIFNKMGNLLGAQVVGHEGVDKQIDILATTMRLHGTIYDLAELELSYAPPFSSAKAPINMLGFVAENILSGMASFAEWHEIDAWHESNREDYILLDVRETVERMAYAIKGSYHIPLGELQKRFDELDKEKLIVTYCAVGVRSYTAARMLVQHGFQKVNILSGGVSFYKSMHHENNVI